MAENYGSLEGVLDANETLEGEIDSHDEMSGEIQFSGGVGGVKDVQVNNESVVDDNKIAHIDLTPYAEKEDVYDKDAVNTLLEGKADTDDIPTKLSQLDNDDNYVQDADYVHTDNNFTDDDKAAIGGIPENITDLSDVEVSNIQNGQVLKWDSNQNKFVNANESSGGSGDVADVKVNGTSVVDPVTKEANIDLTGYAETSDIPTELADLSGDATHRLVTDTEKSTWDNKADVSDIPTVNNNTITIQKNGQNVDSFTLNQDSNKAINIAVPTKTSDLQNDDSFITNTVNNLANYYLKSDTYTQTEVNNLISAAVNGRFEKVTTLPASGEPNVIYLVPKTTALTNNVYDEYIWQDNAWELLGSTEIDLSNYVTTTDLSTALADYVTSSTFNTTIANYYTKTEVGNLLDGKVDKVSGKGLSSYDYDATAKGIVDNVTTNLAGKVDKVNGKGLSTNDYDNTDKAKVDNIDTTTTSISGNPISISGLKANQLAINPIITFEPIQAGSGTPSPSNVRAISGYDKIEVLSCGKNLFDGAKEGTYNSNTGDYDVNTNWYASKKPMAVIAGQSNYVNASVFRFYYDKDFNFIYRDSSGNAVVTTPANARWMHITQLKTSWSSPSTTIVALSDTAIDYEAPNKTTDLSESLGQTVYGGSLDMRSGKLSVTWAKISTTWSVGTSSSTLGSYVRRSFYLGILGALPALDTISRSLQMCDKAPNESGYSTDSNHFYTSDNGTTVIFMPVNTSESTPIEICYPLATPIEIQLTPHEISLLKDYAYVSTNGTSIALDYHNGELASLADVSQLGETVNELGNYFTYVENVSSKITMSSSALQNQLKAYKIGRFVHICLYTGAVASANTTITLGRVGTSLLNTNANVCGSIGAQSGNDVGAGSIVIDNSSGDIKLIYSKTTTYSLLATFTYILP